jgi:sec-independent protein translocase protein TatC
MSPSSTEPQPNESGASDPVEATRMTLGDHLDELRRRLFLGMIAVAGAFVVAWIFRLQTMDVIERPFHFAVDKLNADLVEVHERRLAADDSKYRSDYFRVRDEDGTEVLLNPIPDKLQATGGGETFLVDMKACFYMALFVGGPVLLWQLWRFIAAGLYKEERRLVMSFFPTSLGLFASGVLFGYFVMVPYAIYFLNAGDSLERTKLDIRASEYLSFVATLGIGLGLVFQLPIVMTAVARVGLVEPRDFRRFRGHFVLGSFIVAAMLTPPDPYTQVMMAGPMVALFEVGIWTSTLAAKRHRRAPGAGASA